MKHFLVIYKNSTWELLSSARQKKLIRERPAMAAGLQKVHAEHYEALHILKEVIRSLKKNHRLKAHYCIRYKITEQLFSKPDLIITLGGDGTFLYASHFVNHTPILGINSAPDSSVGYFCTYAMIQERNSIQSLLDSFLRTDSIPTMPMQRIQLYLNDEPVHYPVLNDILIAERNPAATSRFSVRLNETQNSYKCSGAWLSTAWGSSAAWKSGGGRVFPETNRHGKRQFGLLIREPYEPIAESKRARLISEADSFQIVSRMVNGNIYLDGLHRVLPFDMGDTASFKFTETALRKVTVHAKR